MATKAGTELGGHDAAISESDPLRTVRRLKSTPGHERTVALVGADDREVVVERIALGGVNEDDESASMRERAQALAQMGSPHLSRVLSVRMDGSDLVVVESYVAGQWLEELTVAEAKNKSHFLAVAVSLRIVLDVLAALSALHAQKVGGTPFKHHAVAPSHVLVGVDGHARLTGALRPPRLRLASPAGYAAPEVLLGDGTADHRADLYSACVLLWEALSGRKLFEESDRESVLSRQLAGPLPRAVVREAWAEPLADVAAKGLAVSPEDRYSAASEVASAIRLVAQARLAAATRVGRMVESLAEDALARRKNASTSLPPASPSIAPALHRSGTHRLNLPAEAVPTPVMTLETPMAINVAELALASMHAPSVPPPAPQTAPPPAPLPILEPQATSTSVATPAPHAVPIIELSEDIPIIASEPPPAPLAPRRRRMLVPVVLLALVTLGVSAAFLARRTGSEVEAPRTARTTEPSAKATSVAGATQTTAPESTAPAPEPAPTQASTTAPPVEAAPSPRTTAPPAASAPSAPSNSKSRGPRKPRGSYQPEGI